MSCPCDCVDCIKARKICVKDLQIKCGPGCTNYKPGMYDPSNVVDENVAENDTVLTLTPSPAPPCEKYQWKILDVAAILNRDAVNCWASTFNDSPATLTTFNIAYPGVNNPAKVPNIYSYINLNVLGPVNSVLYPPTNPSGLYSSWCFDNRFYIYVGETYTANVVSLLNPNAASLYAAAYNSASVTQPLNIYLQSALYCILYIFNLAYYYENTLGFSFDDIQTAIWTLLFTNISYATSYPYSGPLVNNTDEIGSLIPNVTAVLKNLTFTPANVYYIINDALLNTKDITPANAYTIPVNYKMVDGLIFIPNYAEPNFNDPAQIMCVSCKIFNVCF